jgi:hypothetical protein
MGGPGAPGMLGGAEGKKDMKLKPVPLNKLREESNPHYAEQVLPLRAAIIVGGFPYRAQLEEFREKLRLSSIAEVLAETSTAPGPDGNPLPAFRFLGVDVERAEIGPDGKPLGKDPWKKIPLKEAYTPYLILTAKRSEPDDPKYAPVTIPGLVMPRLKLFRDEKEAAGDGEKKETHNEYPKVEDKLALLRKTLDEINSKDPSTIFKPPPQFSVEGDFDLFQPAGESEQGRGGPGMPEMPGGPGMGVPRGPGMPRGGMPGSGNAGKMRGAAGAPGVPRGPRGPGMPEMPGMGADQDNAPPEYCLVRLIDPTVQPGHVYQYRIRARMANPNYGRSKDVAALSYAQKPELDVDDSKWFVVPDKVTVPPEMHYYAVDQKELDGPKYRGLHWDLTPSRDRATTLQIHRWLEAFSLRTDKTNLLPVGEWVVAERVIAQRGEYVGFPQRIEFPYWRTTQEQFVIASEPGATRRAPGVMVSFRAESSDGRDTVLVDFDGGNQDYERVVSRDEDGKAKTRKVRDAHGTEVLLLTPDGKLLAHEGAEDAKDQERVNRLKEVHKRIKEVKEGGSGSGKPGEPGKPAGGRNPFGGRDT